ncbi:MAG: hypothetical protein EBS21_05885 [Sphingomonadaceae bacterium]|nr:hypothetical protein [Sphingomonadaceae bacterium]
MIKKTFLKIAVSSVALTFSTSVLAHDVKFELTNNSKSTLVDLRLSGSSDPSWGEDILEENIPSGEDYEVTIDELEECEYDLRAVYSDGDTEEVWNVDLCNLDELTINDDDKDQPDPVPETEDGDDDGDDDDGDDDEDDDDEEDGDDGRK